MFFKSKPQRQTPTFHSEHQLYSDLFFIVLQARERGLDEQEIWMALSSAAEGVDRAMDSTQYE